MADELTLEKVHELIDGLSEERDQLQHVSSEMTEPAQWPALCDAVMDVDCYYGIGPSSTIRVPQKLTNSFTRTFDPVRTEDALILASKIVSFLRSVEGQVAPGMETCTPRPQPEKFDQKEVESSFQIAASLWTTIPRQDEIERQIAELSLILDSILSLVEGGNQPEEDRALSAIERAQLIAILETALVILKAPMVEKGLLKRARDWLGEAARKAAQKQAERAFGQLAKEGSELLSDLLSKILE